MTATIANAQVTTDTESTDILQVDDLRFVVRRSERRTTVGVTVERDGSLTLTSPINLPRAQLEQIARNKRFWIYSRLAEKNDLSWPLAAKEYVAGEGFWYLGRSYRLRVIDDSALPIGQSHNLAALRLQQGRFLLRQSALPHARATFIRWYTDHGTARLSRFVQDLSERIDAQPRGFRVRDLGHRWGSCGHATTLNFHWRTILLPPRIIEYVVAHELTHLYEPHHGVPFWRCLERILPDCSARKFWLAQHGARYTL